MTESVSIYSSAEDSEGKVALWGDILTGIRDGRWATPVEAVRNAQGITYDELKKKLPAVTFSGTFTKRSKDPDCIVTYSGIICLDFDKLELAHKVRDLVTATPYTLCAFLSPGGKGVKVLVRVSSELSFHSYAWQRLYWYFFKKFNIKADPSGKDVSRLCFISHDPDLKINEGAKVFEVSKKKREKITDKNKLFGIAKQWTERHYHFTESSRNNYVNLLAFHLNHLGFSPDEAEGYIFQSIRQSDGKLITEYQRTIKSAFSKPSQNIVLYEKQSQEALSQNPIEDELLRLTIALLEKKVPHNIVSSLMYSKLMHSLPEGETAEEHGMGREWFLKTLNRAHQMLVERQRAQVGTKKLLSAEDAIMGVINSSTGKVISTHVPEFDALLQGGYLRGSVYAIVGREGTGKSIYALYAATESAKSGIPSVYWNGEMSNLQIYGRVTKKELGINIRKEIENNLMDDKRRQFINEGLKDKLKGNLFIVSEMNFSSAQITAHIQALKEQQKKEVGLVVIDGISHMEDICNDEIRSSIENSRLLKECAKENDVAILVLIHQKTGHEKHFRNAWMGMRGGTKVLANMDGMISTSVCIDMEKSNPATNDIHYKENLFYLRLTDKRESGKQCDVILKTEDPLKIVVSDDPPSMHETVLGNSRR